jgi:hypothetical protein
VVVGLAGVEADGLLQIADGLLDLVGLGREHQAQVVEGAGVAPVEGHGLAELPDGLVHLAQAHQAQAQVVMGLGILGGQLHDAQELFGRLLDFALPEVNLAQIEAGLGVTGIALDLLLEVLHSLEALQLLLDAALAHGVVLVLNDLQGDLEFGDGLFAHALALVGQPQVVVGAHEVGDQGQDLLPLLDRHVDVALAEIGRAHLVVALHVLGIEGDHLLELLDGSIQPVLIKVLVPQLVMILDLVSGPQRPQRISRTLQTIDHC